MFFVRMKFIWVVFKVVPEDAGSVLRPLTKLLYMKSVLHFGHRLNLILSFSGMINPFVIFFQTRFKFFNELR